MDAVISCRFHEQEYYDIVLDRMVLRLQAITNAGTWYADIEQGNGRLMREKRAQFREAAFAYIHQGRNPGYVELKSTELEMH